MASAPGESSPACAHSAQQPNWSPPVVAASAESGWRRSRSKFWRAAWLACCLTLAGLLAFAGFNGSPSSSPTTAPLPVAANAAEPTTAIERLRVGDRVAGAYSADELTGQTEVDPATWRRLRLRAESRWDDGTLDVIHVEALQPPDWIAEHDAHFGRTVPLPLDLLDMGLPEELRAVVVANEACPPIQDGPGRVVLTTVDHLNDDVHELTIGAAGGEAESIRTTGLHKFYRADDARWVSAQDLAPGDRLDGPAGPLFVRATQKLPGVHRVYNLTVEAEHLYRVSTLGVLVHNTGCEQPGRAPTNRAPVNKNARAYQGESHVYVIKAPDGSVYKVGKSSTGKRLRDAASKRAEAQVRKLNRKDIANGGEGGYRSVIRKDGLPSSGAALDYEKRWRDTYRRLFGNDMLPGNREHLRGRGGL